jgi:hypothetical protein
VVSIRLQEALIRLTVVLLMLAGCGHHEGNRAPEGGTSGTSASEPIPVRDSISTVDSTSATRAVEWIQDYYEAINGHRYRDAYAHWAEGGQASGKSFDEFRKGFEETDRVEVTVGTPGPIGAAAGSRYVEVPVRIAARTRTGVQQNYAGFYTLRLSVVDGATPEQRSWHIYSAAVRPVD